MVAWDRETCESVRFADAIMMSLVGAVVEGVQGDSVRCSKQQVKESRSLHGRLEALHAVERGRPLRRRAGRKKARVDQAWQSRWLLSTKK